LHSTVQEHVFEARARHYDSALHAALSSNEIETDVYHTLVDEVGQALGSLHRQLSLRARALRCDVLEYDDLYAPLEDELASDYSWERTREIVLESVAPLGGPYVDQLRRALTERWVDVDPRPGKRSGAYVNDGAYSAHPFMLLNHVDDFTSLSTVAHESGHLMHSLLSQKNCPYPTAHYVIFVGEVASTLNEQLLFHYMLQRAEDEKRKLALIDHHLERLRRTVFRQAMFAEFELAIHRTVENGRALTADRLDESYLELLRRHHGTARQTMVIDEIYASEWASVPHFFMNFYVYQYATSCVAAMLLAQRILAGERGSLERYLNLLRSGSSEPPIELLCAAGVDMTSPEPIRAAVREMEDLMNRFSELLERRDESRTAQSSKSVGARPNASRTGA
ncbi:MAG: oligoendopeptidase F family protein, partial [Acidobacteriota bacterium]